MIKIMKTLGIFIAVCFMGITTAEAHPGRTDSSGCHACRTNCSSWGLSQGQYHCHNGGSSNINSRNTNTVQTTQPVVAVKSSNNSLKKLEIDGNVIAPTSGIYYYETKNKLIKIKATAEDYKANVSGDGAHVISKVEEKYMVNVIAENGQSSYYEIKVKYVGENNTLQILQINDQEIILDSSKVKYETTFSDSEKEINIKATPEDDLAAVNGVGKKQLSLGENVFKITVTAANQKTKTYEITVNVEESNALATFVTLLVFIVFGMLIWKMLQRHKLKKETN